MNKLTTENFETEVLKSDVPVFVDFYAEWCGPCKMMSPLVDELEGSFDGNVKFGKLNIDESIEIAQTYRVMSIPTFMLFKNGEPVKTMVGGCAKTALEEMIRSEI